MTKAIFIRITAAVTALALTACFAFDAPKKTIAAAEGTHAHKACGGLAHKDCVHGDIVFEELPNRQYLNISSDKNYYLTKDLTDDDLKYIYDLKNITLNLCLNGHKIVTEEAAFYSKEGCVLNICDCKGGGSIENTTALYGAVKSIDGGQTNIYGGSYPAPLSGSVKVIGDDSVLNIYGGKFNAKEEAVDMEGGTVSIYGGEFTSSSNSCVTVRYGNRTGGKLTIYDGELTSSKTCVRILQGDLTVCGGKLKCTAETDDYQYIVDVTGASNIDIRDGEMTCEKSMGFRLCSSKCIFNMSGGSISTYGAAILTENPYNPPVNISGGSLYSSNAFTIGGGILNMTGGTVSAAGSGIYTSGEITGGTIKDCTDCGISVQQNRRVTIGGDVKFENNRFDIELYTADDIFTVKDDFCNTATVRVCDNVPEEAARKITTDGTPESALSKIISADEKYIVKYDDVSGYLYLYNHAHTYDFGHDENEHWQLCTKCGETGEKTAHTWDNGTVTKQPSESETGLMTYACTVCNAEKTEELEMLVHTHTYSDDWTSDETKHWHAATCGHDVKGSEAEHNFGAPTVNPSTCTKQGSEEYVCQTCGRKKTVPLGLAEHSFDGGWQKDGNNHWKVCTVCNTEKSEEAPHTWDGGTVTQQPTESEAGVKTYACTVCGETKTETVAPLEHAHDWNTEWSKDDTSHWHDCLKNCGEKKDNAPHTWDGGTVTQQPTESEAGVITYACMVCGETKTEAAAPLEHTHDWNTEWSRDDTYHWHDCLKNCGEKKDNAPHTWDGGTVTQQPTENEAGVKTYACTVCGKTKTEAIPASGKPENGNVSVDVQPGENAPDTKLKTQPDELAEAVLTAEEQELIKNGTDIKIILLVNDATESVSADDKAKVEAAISELDGYKLGQYLDVNLLKIIGGAQEKISQTNAPITVMFEVPEALRGEMRNYSVIRVHNGETSVLSDLDNDKNTITINTDKFSTYALVYSEKRNSTPAAEGGFIDGNPAPPDESGSDGGNPALPDESGSDGGNPALSDENGSDSGNLIPSESKPTDDINVPAESGGNSSNTAFPNNENSSIGTNDIIAPIEDNDSVSGGAAPIGNNGNPSTGILLSFIPSAAAAAVLAAAVRRKRK